MVKQYQQYVDNEVLVNPVDYQFDAFVDQLGLKM